MCFFDVFKTLCEKKGVSCKRAAEDMGLSNSIATKWKKTGPCPRERPSTKIAAYFGVSVDYLLGDEQAGLYDERGIENTDIRMIARAGRKMTPSRRRICENMPSICFPRPSAMTTPERRQQLYSEMLRFRANQNTVPWTLGRCAPGRVELVPLLPNCTGDRPYGAGRSFPSGATGTAR